MTDKLNKSQMSDKEQAEWAKINETTEVKNDRIHNSYIAEFLALGIALIVSWALEELIIISVDSVVTALGVAVGCALFRWLYNTFAPKEHRKSDKNQANNIRNILFTLGGLSGFLIFAIPISWLVSFTETYPNIDAIYQFPLRIVLVIATIWAWKRIIFTALNVSNT